MNFVVTLAPSADGELVTSERGTVERVADKSLVLRMEDGRRETVAAEHAGRDRLDHGYAVTVHRSQGATVDVAHRLEDGGGRELAYVSMSRARERSTVHVVADDVGQAVEELSSAWRSERRSRWVLDRTAELDPVGAVDLVERTLRPEVHRMRERLRALDSASAPPLSPIPRREPPSLGLG